MVTSSAGPEKPVGPASYTWSMRFDAASEATYTLYRRGIELLEDGDFMDATEPLAEAARRAPEKSSVREALGRAFKADKILAEADPNARRDYELRAAHSDPGLEAGDEAKQLPGQ